MKLRPADPGAFRRLMARWPTGVSVVTAHDGERDFGLTVNALLSVALDPPTVLISLAESADTTPVIERTHAFGVSFLAANQRSLSERFASMMPPAEKFREVPVFRGSLGVPLLEGAIGALECRARTGVPALDHRLFFGEVVAQEAGADATPLVFHRSGYAEALGDSGLTLPSSAPHPG